MLLTLLQSGGAASGAYTLTAQGGSYTLTGASASISRNRVLTAQGGSYSYTGQQVTITYTPGAVNYTLTAQGGAYSLAGQQAVIKRDRNLTASGGAYSLAGAQATLLRSKQIVAQGGAYALAGSSATLLRSRLLTASGGTYALTGQGAVLNRDRYLSAVGGSYTLNGQTITISKSGAYWPLPGDVRLGVTYGPTGADYTGTLQVPTDVEIADAVWSHEIPFAGIPSSRAEEIARVIFSQEFFMTTAAEWLVKAASASELSTTGEQNLIFAIRAADPPIPVDVQKMNGAEVIGDGSIAEPWRGVGVVP